MPAPICVKCQMTMRCERNEQLINDVTTGQFPASYWSGDLFECPVCANAFVVVQTMAFARTAAEQRMLRRNPDESITFAYSPEQREKYADQFTQRLEIP